MCAILALAGADGTARRGIDASVCGGDTKALANPRREECDAENFGERLSGISYEQADASSLRGRS